MRQNTRRIGLLLGMLAAALLLTGCNGTPAAGGGSNTTDFQYVYPSPTAPKTFPVFPGVTPQSGGQSGQKAGPASIYPNPSLTPGDTFPGVTAQEVCVSGYSSSVRSVSTDEKAAVYQRYGIPNQPGQHEVDHFISLELGGSNALTNLWPEAYEPRPGAHEKDTVENALHAAVCSGQMSLQEAQRIITQDWYAYYLQNGATGQGNPPVSTRRPRATHTPRY